MAVVRADVVDGQNVRMIQKASGPCLLFEPAQPVIVGSKRGGQNLDGDLAPQPRVAGPVDLAHSTGPQRTDDLHGSELCARLDSHCWMRGL